MADQGLRQCAATKVRASPRRSDNASSGAAMLLTGHGDRQDALAMQQAGPIVRTPVTRSRVTRARPPVTQAFVDVEAHNAELLAGADCRTRVVSPATPARTAHL